MSTPKAKAKAKTPTKAAAKKPALPKLKSGVHSAKIIDVKREGNTVAVAKKPAPKPAAKKTPPAPKLPPKTAAPISAREEKNGVKAPIPGTVAGILWAVADKLTAKLKRSPARFEFRQAVAELNEKRKETGAAFFCENTASYQYFFWRKFHGVKGREAGLYPKRNSFEAATPRPRKAVSLPTPKPATPAAKKKTVKVAAPKKEAVKKAVATKKAVPAKAPKAPAKPVAPKAPVKAKAPAKKTPAKKASKPATVAKDAAAPAPTPEPVIVPAPAPTPAPGVSSRLAAVSAAASTETAKA